MESKNLTPIDIKDQKISVDFVEVEINECQDKIKCLTDLLEQGVICPEVTFASKTAKVVARKAKLGESVDTRPRCEFDGKLYTFSETQKTIGEKEINNGSYIVQNPTGEEYVVSQNTLEENYDNLGNGEFAPKGVSKSFVKLEKNICFMGPWGSVEYAPKGSYLCIENLMKIYSITNAAFEATYNIDTEKGADLLDFINPVENDI